MIWIGLSALAIVIVIAAVLYALRVRASRATPKAASGTDETPEVDEDLGVTRLGVPKFDLEAALSRDSRSQHD